MGERWTAEAEDLKPAGTPGVMEGGTPRVTLHVTVSKPGSFDAMHGVLTRNRSEPHYLYDPATDRLGQYFPCDVSARAVGNDGTRRTNGHGSVNIQIEVCAMPDGFTTYWKPGPNWAALLRTVRSWGVPDVWPAGRLSVSYADKVDRSWSSYSKAGWFGHCNVPGNDHWDPGPINQAAIFTTSQEDNMPSLAEFGKAVWDSPIVNAVTGKAVAARVFVTDLHRTVHAQGEAIKALAVAQPKVVQDAVAAALAADYDATVTLTPKES